MKSNLLSCFLSLVLLSCGLEDHVTPAETCQLAQLTREGGPYNFTYDSAGSLTRWVITFPVSSSTTDVVQYDFTRDGTGRISSLVQTRVFEGKPVSTATAVFSYTDDLLTSTATTVGGNNPTTISRTFSYDRNRRMSKRLVTDNKSGFTSTETYAYDDRGNCTTYTYVDSDGYESLLESTYDTSKNPEQLLIKSIPFNLLTGLPWSVNAILTTKEQYVDPTGTVRYTSQRTDLKTGAKGYVTSTTLTYDDGYVGTTSYSLINCQ